MVISCPSCSKKYQFNGEAKGQARFRCTGCGSLFSAQEGNGPAERSGKAVFKVLAATENGLISDAVKMTLGDERIALTMVSDGNQVAEIVSKDKPHLLILDAAIQGLFSFSICEMVKKDPSLRDIKIILTAAAFNKKRYKRRPTELFGAESYIEAHMLADELAGKAGELLGIELKAVPASEKTGSSPPGHKGPEDALGHGQGVNGPDDDRKARRLARIIASDILLYHRKKLSHKVEKQDAFALFSQEIEEAVKYFSKRMPGADVAYVHAAIEECLESLNKGAEAAVC